MRTRSGESINPIIQSVSRTELELASHTARSQKSVLASFFGQAEATFHTSTGLIDGKFTNAFGWTAVAVVVTSNLSSLATSFQVSPYTSSVELQADGAGNLTAPWDCQWIAVNAVKDKEQTRRPRLPTPA